MGKGRGLAWFAFCLYLAALLRLVLFKPYIWHLLTAGRLPLEVRLRNANLVPFATIAYYLRGEPTPGVALRNLMGNVLLFIPMGFLLPFVVPRLQRMTHILFVSLAVSLLLEGVQLLTGIGSFDVDDLLLNGLGATVGGLLNRGLRTPGIPARSRG